jgi:hypothetical protein
VAAARVFLEYVVGKPHKAPDPDRIEHHEWQLAAEAPRMADVTELLDNGVPADMAADATRDAVPHLAANRLDEVFDSLNAAPPVEAAAASPAQGPPSSEVLRLLTATLRAAVANGVNGESSAKGWPGFDRPTGDNGGGRTVPTADNGHGPTEVTGDNGDRPGQGNRARSVSGGGGGPLPHGRGSERKSSGTPGTQES